MTSFSKKILQMINFVIRYLYNKFYDFLATASAALLYQKLLEDNEIFSLGYLR